ncbi:MAG: gliding-motility protein MglA [Gemmatimonadetes bacterium]|nr:gliding-motility protein MglA [Gemmatimonadota bacterium]
MPLVNYSTREITCKIVYYGPGRSGKTTNLQYIHERLPDARRGQMISLATETDRTLFFDFLPLDLGTISGFRVRYQLYTVPGQVYYEATRRLVLRGADGVVFVADSQRELLEENVSSLRSLYANLLEEGFQIRELPIVLQYNKRDLPDILPVAELDQVLNFWELSAYPSIAVTGAGVMDTLRAISEQVLRSLSRGMAGSHAARGGTASGQPRARRRAR